MQVLELDLLLLEESQNHHDLRPCFPGRQTTVDGFRKNLELQGQDSVSDWPRGGYGLLLPAEKVGFVPLFLKHLFGGKPTFSTHQKDMQQLLVKL